MKTLAHEYEHANVLVEEGGTPLYCVEFVQTPDPKEPYKMGPFIAEQEK
jgi:hypothetical protein